MPIVRRPSQGEHTQREGRFIFEFASPLNQVWGPSVSMDLPHTPSRLHCPALAEHVIAQLAYSVVFPCVVLPHRL